MSPKHHRSPLILFLALGFLSLAGTKTTDASPASGAHGAENGKRAIHGPPMTLPAELLEPACAPCEDSSPTTPSGNDCSVRSGHCGGPVSSPGSVYLFSGEFHTSAEDLRIRGRGFDFVWARKYRSRVGPDVGMGPGWDFSYDIRVVALDDTPSEVVDLVFDDPSTLSWTPPADPGGPPSALRYCTLRSTDPSDFASAATTTFIEIEGDDPSSTDTDLPALGSFFSYLVRAKNGHRQGPLGADSAGTPREGLDCGVSGPDLVLFDGHTRFDTYRLQDDGTLTAPGFFRVAQNVDPSTVGYTLTFADTGTWSLHPLDASPRGGKIASIADRNGNTMTFQYDGWGRLSAVTDTLGRQITVGYDGNGFLGSVTDFAGRQVRYAYYDGVEPGGSFGDLKSVTTPAVTGTPHGNDFPAGKTTTYTYTTGLAQARLNHNLLTITDARGGTWLANEYAATLDEGDLAFDRVVRQRLGGPADVIDYVYATQAPQPSNNFAVIKAIVNDAVGNVSEHFFDAPNRAVLLHEYTGRADPDQPTGDLTNRPTAPLRPTDPLRYETGWEYGADSLCSRAVYPNRNVEEFGYDALNPRRRSQGNLLQQCRFPGPIGGNPPQVCESYEYDDGGLGCCGTNVMTRHVDARGNATEHTYDAPGNRLHTQHRLPSITEDWEYNPLGQVTAHVFPDNDAGHRRRDEFTYHAAGPQAGYLHQEILDATHLRLATTYEYDAVGNIVRQIDPRGNDTFFVVNQRDQLVREISRPGPGGVRYGRDLYYDANDNLVRVDWQDVDDQGMVSPRSPLTTIYEYGVMSELARICWESGPYAGPIPGSHDAPTCQGLPDADFVRNEYEYDPNGNRTLTRWGEAAENRQPGNIVETLYDERDLLFRVVRAPGDPRQASTQHDYDGNHNLRTTHEGLEGPTRTAVYTYDGYDRLVSVTDAMGNRRLFTNDANGNELFRRAEGELVDHPGDAGNVRLSETATTYDPMDRVTREDEAFFDPSTQLPIDDGNRTQTFVYSAASQLVVETDDRGYATLRAYDTANRLRSLTDAAGNTVSHDYDAGSNLICTTRIDLSDSGGPDQAFVTTYEYDAIDRLIRSVDSAGNTREHGYDSRGNATLSVDALGNVTRQTFDGLGRVVTIMRFLTDDGTGGGNPAGQIVTTKSWDDSSRLVERVDGNGHATTYAYDALNRRISETFADQTTQSTGHDVHDSPTTFLNANGTLVTSAYDGLNRLTDKIVAPGPGVSADTTFESYEYDGLSRIVGASDDDSVVTRAYDSLSRLTSETQNGRSTTAVHDAEGNRVSTTFPGGRSVGYIWDGVNRATAIADAQGTIAEFEYVGPERIEHRRYGNGTETSFQYDGVQGVPVPPGDAGVRRVIDTTHVDSVGNTIDARSYLWDAMSNRKRSADQISLEVQDFEYDSVYHLRREILDGIETTAYDLDVAGNRLDVTGGPWPGAYLMDPTLPEPADAQMNQYTSTPFGGRSYDANGNLLATGTGLVVSYDYRDRMVESDDGFHRVRYAYDPFDRRIAKSTVPSPRSGRRGVEATTEYFYDGGRVCEEQDAGGDTLATYVAGPAGGDVLSMRRGPADYYVHADEGYSTVAVTDALGNVVERYGYEEYGEPSVFDGAGQPLEESAIGNPYLFLAQRYDPETGWYQDGWRYLDPLAGRYTTRDPVGIWAGEAQNATEFQLPFNGPVRIVLLSDEGVGPPERLPQSVVRWAEWLCNVMSTPSGRAQIREKIATPEGKEDFCNSLLTIFEWLLTVRNKDWNGWVRSVSVWQEQAWSNYCLAPADPPLPDPKGEPQRVIAYDEDSKVGPLGVPAGSGNPVTSVEGLRMLIRQFNAFGPISHFEFAAHGAGTPDTPLGGGTLGYGQLCKLLQGRTRYGDCTIRLNSCLAASTQQQRDELQALADKTGCIVWAPKECIWVGWPTLVGDWVKFEPGPRKGPTHDHGP